MTQQQVTVLLTGSPISVSASGPSGWVPNNAALKFTVKGSDPDNPSASLSFSWSCSRGDGLPCFSSISAQGQRAADGSWQLDPAQLTLDATYSLTVTASTADGRTASASISFTPKVIP